MRRINLLRAHGSPTSYLYLRRSERCRCAACRGQKAASASTYGAAHGDEGIARCKAYRAAHPETAADYLAAHREEIAARAGAYNATHREEANDRRRMRKYNLLPGEWDAILAAQDNRCAICGTVDPGGKYGKWQTDHDHDTGLTRGLLCHHCNTGIGHFRDDPERLMAAIKYLAAVTP